jgi:hypothetical protein
MRDPGGARMLKPLESKTEKRAMPRMTTTRVLIGAALALACPALSLAGEPPDMTTLSGTVMETTNASRYTYVRLDTGTTNIWAAGPTVTVKVGDVVSLSGAFPMTAFRSQALNRTFDLVYFAGQIVPAGGADTNAAVALPPGHPAIDRAAAKSDVTLPPGHPDVAADATEAKDAPIDFKGIVKPEGGKTVAEVWAGRAALDGQTVTVRAKVVRVVPRVLDRTWLHLRDGTGAEGENDLTVTTDATAAVGDTVTVSGVVGVNRDFGAGYTYAVIVEKATVNP